MNTKMIIFLVIFGGFTIFCFGLSVYYFVFEPYHITLICNRINKYQGRCLIIRKNLVKSETREFFLTELQEAKVKGSEIVISSSGAAVKIYEVLLVVGQGRNASAITLKRAFSKNYEKAVRISAQVNNFISNTELKSLEVNSDLEDRVVWGVKMAIIGVVMAFFLIVALSASQN